MGPFLPYTVPREGGYQILWEFLRGGGSVCAALWVVVMGCHTLHPAGAGELTELGGVKFFQNVCHGVGTATGSTPR